VLVKPSAGSAGGVKGGWWAVGEALAHALRRNPPEGGALGVSGGFPQDGELQGTGVCIEA
jgi:hypothetical protein